MLKKLLILFLAFAPLAAIAQEVKIAFINAQDVFVSMPEISNIETQLNAKQEEVTKNMQALQEEYSKKAEEFDKNPASSDAVKQDQQKQMAQIEERYQVYMQNSQQELGQLRQTLLEPLNKKIQDAIKAVGDENKFLLVVDISSQSSVVYLTPSAVDITPLVKTKLGLK